MARTNRLGKIWVTMGFSLDSFTTLFAIGTTVLGWFLTEQIRKRTQSEASHNLVDTALLIVKQKEDEIVKLKKERDELRSYMLHAQKLMLKKKIMFPSLDEFREQEQISLSKREK